MYFPKLFQYLGLLTLVFLCGCPGGGDGDRVPVYNVTGKVTMSGAPVANAAVTFAPAGKAQNQPVALGRTNTSGEFTLTTYDAEDGAAAGEYVVLVTKSGAAPASSDASAMHDALSSGQPVPMHSAQRSSAAASSALPDKYSRLDQSDLRATVNPDGENHFPIELQP